MLLSPASKIMHHGHIMSFSGRWHVWIDMDISKDSESGDR